MRTKLNNLALEIGGSHYPVVSQTYLARTVELVYQDAVQALADNGYPDAASMLTHYYTRTYASLDQ